MLHKTHAMSDTHELNNRMYKAIADATRRGIVDELRHRDRQSLFEIYTRVVTRNGGGQSRQAFSRHLSVLEEVGIIRTEWQGTTKLHSLDTAPLARLAAGWLAQFKED